MDSLLDGAICVEPLAVLSRLRTEFPQCLTAWGDELFELAAAVLCAGEPVRTVAVLSLAQEHRRGHGVLYDAVNHREIAIGRLRRSLAGLPLPRPAEGRLMQAAAHYNYCCPWSAMYQARRPVTIAGRHLRPMQEFTFDVLAEEMAEGGEFTRRLVGPFHPNSEIDSR